MRDQAGKEMEGAFQAQCAKAACGPEGWGDWQQMKLGGPDTDQKTIPRGTGFGSRRQGAAELNGPVLKCGLCRGLPC